MPRSREQPQHAVGELAADRPELDDDARPAVDERPRAVALEEPGEQRPLVLGGRSQIEVGEALLVARAAEAEDLRPPGAEQARLHASTLWRSARGTTRAATPWRIQNAMTSSTRCCSRSGWKRPDDAGDVALVERRAALGEVEPDHAPEALVEGERRAAPRRRSSPSCMRRAAQRDVRARAASSSRARAGALRISLAAGELATASRIESSARSRPHDDRRPARRRPPRPRRASAAAPGPSRLGRAPRASGSQSLGRQLVGELDLDVAARAVADERTGWSGVQRTRRPIFVRTSSISPVVAAARGARSPA